MKPESLRGQPLPASSPHLGRHRFQVQVLGPRNARGGRLVRDVGRFLTHEGAREWADLAHPDAEVVVITLHSCRRGWTPQHVATRTDGEWAIL